ncbi:hypothetical protein M501DRAFT_1018373 [Patellaria atrata CBS 101060]|uniref:Uncharacterized protein n=1 Tax=Patellaria atrata CBS 101060 TaxID=1346257 RepID=A0A9P4VPQ1_9PEZI|nr:hypothetical protein M501DRAFT_1018373 [Patellaria atrata CBS 101060]
MSDTASSSVDLSQHSILNLTPEEKRVFGALFAQADTEKIGVVTGEVAVKFFERTKLAPAVLGEIWQIADTENRGLLTSAGFCQVLRLIGHYQAGRDPTPELAFQPGPLPKFEGLNLGGSSAPPQGPPPSTIRPQNSGPIRVPPLTPDKATEYAALFEKSGAHNGLLPGETAKSIFEKAGLPNDVLGRIWNLADTEQRGALGVTEFIIAMHLLASYKSRVMQSLPVNLPVGLYEAASRRIQPPPGRSGPPSSAIPRQFSGSLAQRTQSPLARPPYGTPPQSAAPTGNDWLITPNEKNQYDNLFNKVDTEGRGYITGEQAVSFFSDSGLPEDILASIWDLADINSEGQLSRDEFAVAMYLIRQQRGKNGANLPASLPPNLVPPSMRNQIRPPPQPTAPAFDNAAYSSNLPKSASEDLFGLDAFSNPPPQQQPQSTGGSATYNRQLDLDPFGSKATSPTSPQGFQSSPLKGSSAFKPFVPSSSFGQGLNTHSTGASAASSLNQNRGHVPSAMDDLLGDNDPEVSKKLTQETSELANMSNQIGTLRNQMQEVQAKKSTTENDLSSATTQKRDLELRLSQFRSQYEQEVKNVKSLEDRLNTSRNETRKLQQEYALIEGTYQDLQNQHRQLATALDADQRENANLKERIRQVNTEIAQLRPQLDKLRSDARQQKGLVAINKKQLSTNEGERDKTKGEIGDLTRAAQESARSSQPTPQEPRSGLASPAASITSQSTNPFFRKSPPPIADNAMSPSGFARETKSPQGNRDFDNVFGPSFSSSQTTAPPPTSFRSDSQSHVPTFSQSGQSVRSSEPDVPTPSTSPPLSSYHESPRTVEPPVPPESRQFGSNLLPLRDNVPRTDSFSSSVKVSAPGSRYGTTGADTPTTTGAPFYMSANEQSGPSRDLSRTETNQTETGSAGKSLFDRNMTSSPAASGTSDTARPGSKSDDRRDIFQNFGAPSGAQTSIPGAFPGDTNSPIQPTPTGESTLSDRSKASTKPSEGFQGSRTDPFTLNRDQPPRAAKVDFDAAFAGFGGGRQFPEKQHTGSSVNGSVDSGGASRFNQEFPPIESLDNEDDSDSNSEAGFADNFTSASPRQQRQSNPTHGQTSPQPGPSMGSTGAESLGDDFFRARPTVTSMDSSTTELPTPNAQKSPPSYEQSTAPPPGSRSQGRDSNQFPPEFGGLLPARTDPTKPQGNQPSEKQFNNQSTSQGQTLFGGPLNEQKRTTSSGNTGFSTSPPPADTPVSTAPSDAYHSAVSFPSGGDKGPSSQSHPPHAPDPPKRQQFNDDFDVGFDDLSDAKEADDKGDDDFMISPHHREAFDEFNPVFDSPIASKSNTMQSQQTPTGKFGQDDSFGDFEHNLGGQGQGQSKAPQQPQAASSHDWDAIFSGLDQQSPDKHDVSPEASKSQFPSLDSPVQEQTPQPSSSKGQQQPPMPPLGRALTSGTEHDDPILKKLTAMGYPRQDALSALEKFDYDINKAADFLTSVK